MSLFCSRFDKLQSVDPGRRDILLANYIQTVLIDCHEIDNEERRQSLFGISSGLATPENGHRHVAEPILPSTHSALTVGHLTMDSGPSSVNTTAASSSIRSLQPTDYGMENCPECNKQIVGTTKNRRTSMRKHLKTHWPIESRRTSICDVCGNGYVRSDLLGKHRWDAHSIVNPRAIKARRGH